MLINLLKYSLIFVVSVLLQVLLFNKILLLGLATPYIYPLFLLLLPFAIPRALLLFVSFALGLTIDIFTNTPGVHASACLLIGFVRPGVLLLISSRDTLDSVVEPRAEYMGVGWFVGYTSILIVLHHFILFFIEAFTFSGLVFTLLRIVLSAVLSITLIVLSQYLIFRK